MSTILNALKRLEDESRAEDAKEIPASMAGRGGVSGSNPRLRFVIALAGLTILVGSAVFWVYTDRSSREVLPREAAKPEPQVKTATSAPPQVAPSTAPLPKGGRAQENRTAQGHLDRPPPKSTTKAQVNTTTVVTSLDYVPPNPEEKKSLARLQKPLVEGQTNDVSPQSPAVQQSPPQDPYALAEVLPKDTLQLQAISWSDIASARITVIAGQILREGHNVDGYTLIEIRPKDVIVEKAGKKWKVVYGGQ